LNELTFDLDFCMRALTGVESEGQDTLIIA